MFGKGDITYDATKFEDDSIVYQFGGGVDYHINHRWSVRLVDFQYQFWNLSTHEYPAGALPGAARGGHRHHVEAILAQLRHHVPGILGSEASSRQHFWADGTDPPSRSPLVFAVFPARGRLLERSSLSERSSEGPRFPPLFPHCLDPSSGKGNPPGIAP